MPSAADSARVALELRAGRAVAAGALLAGPLAKRSEWLHSWNRRFCVLTTEELSWSREGASAEPSSESRSVRMHSGVRLVARDGVLLLQSGKDATSALWFSAASEPELRVWHRTLRALIDSLDSSARVARIHVHENASLFSSAAFSELPHLGSRNLREGRLAKPFFRCATEPQGATGTSAIGRSGKPPPPKRHLGPASKFDSPLHLRHKNNQEPSTRNAFPIQNFVRPESRVTRFA